MKYYLMDGSGYMRAQSDFDTKIKSHIFNQTKAKRAFIYMPQFTVTDVFRKLIEEYLVKKKVTEAEYEKKREEFIGRIRSRNLIYVYDLHRYHNLNAKDHEIYKAYWETCRKNNWNPENQKFGAQHVLMIAMALELKKRHISEGDEVFIYTNTPVIADVVSKYDLKIEIPGAY